MIQKYIKKIIPKTILNKIRSLRQLDYIKKATYNDDGLITFHDSDFLKDPLFIESYKLGEATKSWLIPLEWRAYIVCWAANKAKQLEGDFVECGVNRGGYSRMAMNYINFKAMKNKKFYLLDTYCGCPDKYKGQAAPGLLSSYGECYEDAVKTFGEFGNAVIVRGTVPDTLPQVRAEKICYLSIDMNCAEPELAAIEFFWDKLSSGAIVVLDDYGYGPESYSQKIAFNDFAERKGVQTLLLPTGQGLLFKP